MKSIISIPLLLMLLLTGTSVKFSTHYCGGNFSSLKVSLTGEMASCGMEKQPVKNSTQDLFSRHCCDNINSSYTIATNYSPSWWIVNYSKQVVIQTVYVPSDLQLSNEFPISKQADKRRPPGIFSPNYVDQPVLCIFQI
jgi:hypothetical protein